MILVSGGMKPAQCVLAGGDKCQSIPALSFFLSSSFNSESHCVIFRRIPKVCSPISAGSAQLPSHCIPINAFGFCCLVPHDACVGAPKWEKKLDRLCRGCTFANVVFQQPGELPRQMILLENLIAFTE